MDSCNVHCILKVSNYLSETPVFFDSHHLLPFGTPRDSNDACGRWQSVTVGAPNISTCNTQGVHGKGTIGKGDTEGGGNGGVPVDPCDQAAGRVEDMGGKKDCQGREGAGRVCHREGGWVMCRQVVGTPLRQPDHRRRLQLLAPAKVYFVYSSHLTQLLLYLSW